MKSARTQRRVARVRARLTKYDAWTPTLERLVTRGRYQDAARLLRQYSVHGTFSPKQKRVIRQAIEALNVLHAATHSGRIETPYVPPMQLVRRDLRELPGHAVTTSPSTAKRPSIASTPPLRSHRISVTPTPPARFARRKGLRRPTVRTPVRPRRIAPTPRAKPAPTPRPKPKPVTVTRAPTPVSRAPARPTHPKVYETIKRLEGLPRNRDPGLRYKNIRGIGTIGYGHMITPQSPALFRRLFGSKFDAEAVVRGKKPLTKAQYERLLEHDVDVRVDQVRDRLPNYDTWPPRVQTAVMQAKFRGDLGPQTTRHLKEGDFKAAAQEIVRTSEYRRPGNEGITRRLDEAAGAFRNYAEKPVPAPAPTPAPAPVARKRMRNRVANVGRAVQKRTSELGTQAQRMAKRAETHVREERARLPARQRDWSKRVNEARKRGENAATAVARRARPMMDQTAARVRDFGDQVRRRARNARAELDRRTKPLRNRVERTGLPRA